MIIAKLSNLNLLQTLYFDGWLPVEKKKKRLTAAVTAYRRMQKQTRKR